MPKSVAFIIPCFITDSGSFSLASLEKRVIVVIISSPFYYSFIKETWFSATFSNFLYHYNDLTTDNLREQTERNFKQPCYS